MRDYTYTSTNDPYGYEAWEASTSIADKNTVVQLFCDNANEYNICPTDVNDRFLAYVSVDDIDVSTELTRLGLAIPNVGRTPIQSEREKTICQGLLEAVQDRRQLWSMCAASDSDAQCFKNGVADLLSTRTGEFDYMYERCEYISTL